MSDIEEEAERFLLNPTLWLAVADAKRREPGMFVSGWEEDTDGVEERSEDEMDTDDPEKGILRAAEHGDLDTVQRLVAENPALVKTRDSDEYTPMHRASYNNHPQVISFLLEQGADPQALTENGWTPLHCASCWGCYEAAQVLIEMGGADVNAQTHGHLTPLHLAAACNEDPEGGVKTCHLLLKQDNVDLTIKSAANETSSDIAKRTSRVLHNLFQMPQGELRCLDVRVLNPEVNSENLENSPGQASESGKSMNAE